MLRHSRKSARRERLDRLGALAEEDDLHS